MPATPSASRRTSAAKPETPRDMKGQKLLVPRHVFPKEKVPKSFVGWEARVTGTDRVHDDGLHLNVRFDGYEEEYHFPASQVRTWVVEGGDSGSHEEAGEEAQPPARKSARKATGSGARTPTTQPACGGGRHSVRRAAAAVAAAAAAADEGEDEEAQAAAGKSAARASRGARSAAPGLADLAAVAAAAATEPAPGGSGAGAQAAAPAQSGSGLRKCKASSAVGGTSERQAAQEDEEARGDEMAWLDKAADAAKQVALTVGAVGVCYGMLKVLYPLEGPI